MHRSALSRNLLFLEIILGLLLFQLHGSWKSSVLPNGLACPGSSSPTGALRAQRSPALLRLLTGTPPDGQGWRPRRQVWGRRPPRGHLSLVLTHPLCSLDPRSHAVPGLVTGATPLAWSSLRGLRPRIPKSPTRNGRALLSRELSR